MHGLYKNSRRPIRDAGDPYLTAVSSALFYLTASTAACVSSAACSGVFAEVITS